MIINAAIKNDVTSSRLFFSLELRKNGREVLAGYGDGGGYNTVSYHEVVPLDRGDKLSLHVRSARTHSTDTQSSHFLAVPHQMCLPFRSLPAHLCENIDNSRTVLLLSMVTIVRNLLILIKLTTGSTYSSCLLPLMIQI